MTAKSPAAWQEISFSVLLSPTTSFSFFLFPGNGNGFVNGGTFVNGLIIKMLETEGKHMLAKENGQEASEGDDEAGG